MTGRPTNSNADLCSTCSHRWHGLPCQHIMSRFEKMGMTAGEQCQCKGPFAINTLDEGPRTSSKKGIW